MGAQIRVQYVSRTSYQEPYARSAEVGGFGPSGVPWHLTLPEAVRGVQESRWSFFVKHAARPRENVVVALTPDGIPYLKSVNDEVFPESLLRLPDAPVGL